MSEKPTEDQREEFWDRLEECRSGMLEAEGRFVPMTHNLEPEDGKIWFLTAKDTDMAKAAQAGAKAKYILCNDGKSFYAAIEGTLATSDSQEKLDEVWSEMAKIWFEEGKQDPDLLLIRLDPSRAEAWLGPESGLKFLWSVVKSKVTEEEPDFGSHFTLTF